MFDDGLAQCRKGQVAITWLTKDLNSKVDVGGFSEDQTNALYTYLFNQVNWDLIKTNLIFNFYPAQKAAEMRGSNQEE